MKVVSMRVGRCVCYGIRHTHSFSHRHTYIHTLIHIYSHTHTQALRLQLHRVLRLVLQQTERMLLASLSGEEGQEGVVDAKHGEFEREVNDELFVCVCMCVAADGNGCCLLRPLDCGSMESVCGCVCPRSFGARLIHLLPSILFMTSKNRCASPSRASAPSRSSH